MKLESRHEDVLGSGGMALDGDEWLISRPGHLTPRERVPVIYLGMLQNRGEEEYLLLFPGIESRFLGRSD
jgi:hypothetical protein